MTEKKRPNRMLKNDEKIEREEPEPPEDQEEPSGYPCKFCQKPSVVIRTYPTFRTEPQWPYKVVRRRQRRCTVCRRTFSTQELYIDDETRLKVDI